MHNHININDVLFSINSTDITNQYKEVLVSFQYGKHSLNYPIRIRIIPGKEKEYYFEEARVIFDSDVKSKKVKKYINEHYGVGAFKNNFPIKTTIFVSACIVMAITLPLVLTNNNRPKSPFDGGNGSKSNPYQIVNSSQFSNIANLINNPSTYDKYKDKYFILEKNIDAATFNCYIPIGNSSDTPFLGHLDGNHKTIFNLNISNEPNNNKPTGLFGILDGEVHDLVLENPLIISNSAVGALAGASRSNCKISNITINNARIDTFPIVTDEFTSSDGYDAGGLIGYADGGDISNINFTNTKIRGHHNVGGIIGNAINTDINTVNIDESNSLYYTYAYQYIEGTDNKNINKAVGLNEEATLTDVIANPIIENQTFEVANPNQFREVIEKINNLVSTNSSYTCNFLDDFDMTGVPWNDVNLAIGNNKLLIDGKNHTISNLNISGEDNNVGLIAKLDVNANAGGRINITNLTMDNSYFEGKTGDDLARVSAFIGYTGNFNFENCHIKNSTFKSDKYIGGFVGYDADGSGSRPLNVNCSIDNCNFISTNTDDTVSISFGGFCGYTQTPHYLKGFDATNLTLTPTGEEKASHLGLYYGTMNCNLYFQDCKQKTTDSSGKPLIGRIASGELREE